MGKREIYPYLSHLGIENPIAPAWRYAPDLRAEALFVGPIWRTRLTP